MNQPGFVRVQPEGVLLAIKLQPRSSINEIGQPHGHELRVKVTAPPVDAAANEALLRLLAKVLHCGRNKLTIIKGHTSRHKIIKVDGLSVEDVLAKLSP